MLIQNNGKAKYSTNTIINGVWDGLMNKYVES